MEQKEQLMGRGGWLMVRIIATAGLIGAALFVGDRLRENDDLLRGHGSVVAARGAWSGDAAGVVVGRDMQRHDYGGLIVWGVTLVLIGLLWLIPLVVAALRPPSSPS